MKKFFITLLLFLCTYVFIGCGEKDYSLEVKVIEKVYVGDSSNYEVTLLPDNTKLTEYEYSNVSPGTTLFLNFIPSIFMK